jgi:hypothetical protein
MLSMKISEKKTRELWDCPQCGNKDCLEITGVGYYGDTITVKCSNCSISEVEPDGLGAGGQEFMDAQMIETEREVA